MLESLINNFVMQLSADYIVIIGDDFEEYEAEELSNGYIQVKYVYGSTNFTTAANIAKVPIDQNDGICSIECNHAGNDSMMPVNVLAHFDGVHNLNNGSDSVKIRSISKSFPISGDLINTAIKVNFKGV